MGERRWFWQDWRIFGGAPVPPARRTLRWSDGVDAASIGADVDDAGGGADIARDFGDLGDPLAEVAEERRRPD
jgi:hypothetical protein